MEVTEIDFSNGKKFRFIKKKEGTVMPKMASPSPKGARAAKWSCGWFILTTFISVSSLMMSHSIEDLLSTVIFITMTWVEFKVLAWFKKGDTRAPIWGFRNQCAFATFFLIYGGYHYFTVVPFPEVVEFLGAEMANQVVVWERKFYLAVGIGGALGQLLVGYMYIRHGRKMTGTIPSLASLA